MINRLLQTLAGWPQFRLTLQACHLTCRELMAQIHESVVLTVHQMTITTAVIMYMMKSMTVHLMDNVTYYCHDTLTLHLKKSFAIKPLEPLETVVIHLETPLSLAHSFRVCDQSTKEWIECTVRNGQWCLIPKRSLSET